MPERKPQKEKLKKGEEKQLFSKIKQRDENAFLKAYDLYVDEIYRFVFFKVSDKDDAQDLTSAIFLKAWDYIQKNNVKDFKTLRALFYQISRTSIIDHYRKDSKIDEIKIDDGENRLDIKDETQDILKQVEIASDFAILENKLNELKDDQREIIILRYINELSISEIAKIIGKSRGNTRVKLFRALQALKELVKSNDS